jgi:hypothetical protein
MLSGNADSSNDETRILLSNVEVSMENTDRGNYEQRKPQKETSADGTIPYRTSTRQRKVPITRKEDFYGNPLTRCNL